MSSDAEQPCLDAVTDVAATRHRTSRALTEVGLSHEIVGTRHALDATFLLVEIRIDD